MRFSTLQIKQFEQLIEIWHGWFDMFKCACSLLLNIPNSPNCLAIKREGHNSEAVTKIGFPDCANLWFSLKRNHYISFLKKKKITIAIIPREEKSPTVCWSAQRLLIVSKGVCVCVFVSWNRQTERRFSFISKQEDENIAPPSPWIIESGKYKLY